MTIDRNGVRWEGDGSYTPVCELCGYEGKPRWKHDQAVAAVKQHKTMFKHRLAEAQAAVHKP